MSTSEQQESVRVSFMCPAALVANIKAMSERSGVPLHVLLVRMCEQLARNGIALKVEPITSVSVSGAPNTRGVRTDSAPTAQQDDEDTMQCKDCALVLPLSEFRGKDLVHYNCRDPGADLVALRQEAAGLAPMEK